MQVTKNIIQNVDMPESGAEPSRLATGYIDLIYGHRYFFWGGGGFWFFYRSSLAFTSPVFHLDPVQTIGLPSEGGPQCPFFVR